MTQRTLSLLPNSKLTYLAILCISILLTACGGSDNNNSGQQFDTSGQYDMTEYLFHSNLDVVGGESVFTTLTYKQVDGTKTGFDLAEKMEKTADNLVKQTAAGSDQRSYLIKSDRLVETVHIANNETRDHKRFVDVGETYLDATQNNSSNNDALTQRAVCKVIAHLDSFDLLTATGEHSLASGVYQDVLYVNCQTGFVVEKQFSPHTNLDQYYAKDVGLIFSEGSIIFFGEVYLISEF